MTGEGEHGDDPLMREAAGWFARMRAPDAEESRPRFEAWLAADPGHRSAYSRAAEVFAMGKLLAEPAAPAPPVPPGARRRLAIAASAALLLALTASAWLLDRPDADHGGPAADAPPALATAEGSGREQRLADGSRLVLAGATRVRLAYTQGERRILLLAGRARFDVFHESRPFVVLAGGGTITARGTLFDVAVEGARVDVRLIRGSVDVAMPAGGPVRRLRPGERLSFAAAPAPAAAAAAGDQEAGVEPGARDYDDVALARLVAESNRGARRPILIAGPALAQRRVSGRFRIDETELLADRLALLLGLSVDRSDPARLVLRPR